MDEGRPCGRTASDGEIYLSGATGAAADGSIPTDFTAQAANATNEVASRLPWQARRWMTCTSAHGRIDRHEGRQAFNDVYLKYFKPGRCPSGWRLASHPWADLRWKCNARRAFRNESRDRPADT